MAGTGSSQFLGDTSVVYEARMLEVEENFGTLPRREDYANEDAYRQALVEQYLRGRDMEYQLHVKNEAMKAYNVSYGDNQRAGMRVQNNRAWSGYAGNRYAQDSCYSFTPEIVQITSRGMNNQHCCAISSTSYTQCISDRMGYQGDDNLIVARSRVINGDVGRRNNCFAASSIHYMDSIPPEFTSGSSGNVRQGGEQIPQGTTLSQGIRNGLINIGDEFSIRTGQANGNTTTGCHAMYLVDIEKDAEGNVISYTLGGNNPPTLEVVTADKFNSHYYGTKALVSVVHTNDWIKEQDKARVDAMSISELEEAVRVQSGNISSVVEDMRETEDDYIAMGGYSPTYKLGRAGSYRSYYEDLTRDSQVYIDDYNTRVDEVAARNPDVIMVIPEVREKLSNIDIPGVEEQNDITTTGFTQEERQDIESTFDGQVEDAEWMLQDNREQLNEGVYGNDVEQMAQRTDELETIPQKTEAQLQKEAKMRTWFKTVKLNTDLVDVMVSKYGIDVAYDLALKSMESPAQICNNTDGQWRNSKGCINYLIENEVTDEVVANITERSADDVAGARPLRDDEKIQPLGGETVQIQMNPSLQARLYGVKSL